MLRGVQVVVSGMALAMLLAAANVARAQDAPAKPVLALEGDAVVMTILIKPDKTADFESVIGKYMEAFQKSEKPARKQQLAGMKFFKSTQPGPQGAAVYVVYVDPVVKDEEYDISRVVAEVFPTEAMDVFNKYKDAFAGRAITALNKLP